MGDRGIRGLRQGLWFDSTVPATGRYTRQCFLYSNIERLLGVFFAVFG